MVWTLKLSAVSMNNVTRLPNATARDEQPTHSTSEHSHLWAFCISGRWSLYVVYLCAAWGITRIYWLLTMQLEEATIERMVYGTAEAPFCYRVLMPWIMKFVMQLNGLNDLVLTDYGLRILLLFGTMVLLRRWMRHFVDPVVADISPLLLGVVLPGTFDWYWTYDFSGFLLYTASLLALYERRYQLFLLLLVIGTLNRETAALLIGIFAVTQWHMLGPRQTLKWIGIQLFLFGITYSAIRLFVHPVGGEFMELHIVDNLQFLTGRIDFNSFENGMVALAGVGFLWLLAPWRWKTKPIFLRRTCWILPLHAGINLVTGRLAEPRLWNEWIPIIMVLAIQSLMSFRNEETALNWEDEMPKEVSLTKRIDTEA